MPPWLKVVCGVGIALVHFVPTFLLVSIMVLAAAGRTRGHYYLAFREADRWQLKTQFIITQ